MGFKLGFSSFLYLHFLKFFLFFSRRESVDCVLVWEVCCSGYGNTTESLGERLFTHSWAAVTYCFGVGNDYFLLWCFGNDYSLFWWFWERLFFVLLFCVLVPGGTIIYTQLGGCNILFWCWERLFFVVMFWERLFFVLVILGTIILCFGVLFFISVFWEQII